MACYWVFTEAECLGHEITMLPELSIMNWVLSDPETYTVGHAQQYMK